MTQAYEPVLPLQFPQNYNMVTHFVDRHVAEGRGEKIAMICGEVQLTYFQLLDEVNRFGNALKSLGVEPEQRVLLLLPDSPEFVAAYFGAIKIGAIAVPTNTALRASDYGYFLDQSRAVVLVVHHLLMSEVASILPERRHLKHVIECGSPEKGDFLDWNLLLREQSPELKAAPAHPDDAAFWLWTSGSTLFPKGVVHLQHDWACCCEGYARGVLEISSQDRTFSSSKLFHAYGLGNGLMFPFYVGATTVLFSGRPKADVILRTAHHTKPSLFFSVPSLYAAMLERMEEEDCYDLSSIRLAVSAAEPLPAEIFKRWKRRFGTEILDGIGSTEVLHIYASSRSGEVKPGSTGRPVPGYELKITDEKGLPVPKGEVGDLWVRGESTAPCYWRNHQLSKQKIQGEWFCSGDKFRMDEDDFLWYEGRSDDLFRVSGQWVSPIEVENALIEHPAVLEAAVVPYETIKKLVKPKAFVVLKKNRRAGDTLVRELQEFVKNRITPYKYPRFIEFVTELPKSAAGKIRRSELRARANATAGAG